MARVGVALSVLVLAGCLGGVDPTGNVPAGRAPCDVMYPDGSAFECDRSQVTTQGIQSTPPALNSGWGCVVHLADDGGHGFFDLFSHTDGRVGFYWDMKMERAGGFGFVEGAMFYGTGGQAMVLPYQQRGFVVFPQAPPERTVEIYLVVRHFLLDILEGDAWSPAKNATMTIGSFAGHPWYVWNFDGPNGNQYLDIVAHRPDPGFRRQYSPSKLYLETEDLSLFATAWGRGFKDAARSLNADPLRQTACANMPINPL